MSSFIKHSFLRNFAANLASINTEDTKKYVLILFKTQAKQGKTVNLLSSLLFTDGVVLA